jgi:hypothetical protein
MLRSTYGTYLCGTLGQVAENTGAGGHCMGVLAEEIVQSAHNHYGERHSRGGAAARVRRRQSLCCERGLVRFKARRAQGVALGLTATIEYKPTKVRRCR